MESNTDNFSQRLCDDEGHQKFYIITNDDGQMSENVQKAFEIIREQCPESEVVELYEAEVLKKQKEELDNETGVSHYFIFDQFKGAGFKHITKMEKIFVLSPKCVLSVLIDKMNLQEDLFHFHNLSMRDMFVCFATITDQSAKDRMKRIINYMGGLFSNGLKNCTTHLVTEDLFSKKYYYAGETNMKIMKLEWLEEVWRLQQTMSFKLRADDVYFDKFKLPMFYKLVITSTGISVEEKKVIIKLVEDHGGEFYQSLKTSIVKILIMTSKDIGSLKHKTALKYNIHCVEISWIKDSIAAGYSLPLDKYLIQKETRIKASTPERHSARMDQFEFENTMLSDITVSQYANVSLEGTHDMNFTSNQRDQSKFRPQIASTLKNAETSNVERRVSRSISKQLLNSTAASTSTSSNITLQNKLTKNDTFKKPQPVAQRKEDLKSHVSNSFIQQNVVSMKIPPAPLIVDENDDNDGSDEQMSEDASFIQFLVGMRVYIYGFEHENEVVQLLQELEKTGATVMDSDVMGASYNKTIDYVITPQIITGCDIPTIKFHHIVNDEWLAESIAEGRCLEIKLYHNPIFLSHCVNDILKGETFVMSSYNNQERPYISVLIKNLGGQKVECLKKNDDMILLCPFEEGRKYVAAKQWKMTALRAEWVYNCYKQQTRCDETEFLLKDVQPSKRNCSKNDRSSIIPCSQDTMSPMDCDDDYSIKRRQAPLTPVGDFALPKRIIELRPALPSTPKTPSTPSNSALDGDEEDLLSISNLCEDMPTPQRELTKAVLRGGQAQNQISPRAQRQKELLKTPGMTQKHVFEDGSPMPELPECMKPLPEDFSIRPDPSPESQWYWKRKMSAADGHYIEKSDSLRKAMMSNIVTPPYHVTRYEFFKKRMPNYDSPDPRGGGCQETKTPTTAASTTTAAAGHYTVGMSHEADNFFNFDETDLTERDKSPFVEIKPVEMNEKRPQKKAVKGYDLDYREDEEEGNVFWAANTQAFNELSGSNSKDKSRKTFLTDITNTQKKELEQADNYNQNDNDEEEEDVIEIGSGSQVDDESDEPQVELNSDGEEIDFEGLEDKKLEWSFGVSSGHYADNEIQKQISESIVSLGGRVSEDDFNYLVMQKLVKSPKFFRSLARGKFILHPDFIKDSFEQKKFVDTSKYEYGNPSFKCEVNLRGGPEELLAGPYACRQAIKKYSKKYYNGLFTDMTFIIACNIEKHEIFKDVVLSGGGKVVTPPYEDAALRQVKIDYCLIESEKSLSLKDRRILQACNIPIKNVKFLYEYLLSSNF